MADLWTKKKKILTRKDRFRITDDNKKKDEEMIEKQLQQAEHEIQNWLMNEKIKLENAKSEYKRRYKTIKVHCEKFSHYQRHFDETTVEKHIRNIRENYPNIRKLDRIIPYINEYISKWHTSEIEDKHDLKHEIESCIRMLLTLYSYIAAKLNIRNAQNWYECMANLREIIYSKIDKYSYKVLKNIEKEMSYLNSDIMYFKDQSEYYTLALWTVLDKPKGNGKEDKFPLMCHFEDVNVNIHLPKTFSHEPFVVRCLWMRDDFFSVDCRTWNEANANELQDFLQYCQDSWQNEEELRNRCIKMQNETEKQLGLFSRIKYLIPSSAAEDASSTDSEKNYCEDGVTKESHMSPSLSKFVNFKSYTEVALTEEQDKVENIKESLTVTALDKYECNMRKYVITGGIYSVEIFKRPFQPKIVKDGALLRIIIGNDSLQPWNYLETYEPPNSEADTGQSIDDDDEDVENNVENSALSKLVLIIIKLPDHVLWLDTPIPVHWDSKASIWSTEYIYEVKFNEEKQTVSFRAGKMTAFALAVFRYSNFPLQGWELKQIKEDEVFFSITTSILVLEFILHPNEICLTLLENANTDALQKLIGIFYEPKMFIHLLKQGGINIFPNEDVCLYVDNVPLKHCATEQHLYHCMAFLCLGCYSFSWSKWNLLAGYKNFVLQTRKLNDTNKLILANDQCTFFMQNTDNIPSFTDLPEKFYPDLLNLAEEDGNEESRKLIENSNQILVETINYVLLQTRVLNF